MSLQGKRRLAVSLVAVAVLASLAVAGTSALAGPVHCAATGSSTVLASSRVRVYRLHGSYYGCLTRTGHTRFLAARHTLTLPEPRISYDTTTFQQSATGGDWVAYTKLTHGSVGDTSTIVSVELSSGSTRRLKISDDLTAPEGLAISRSGWLAWLMPYIGGNLPVTTGGVDQLAISRLGGDHHPDLVLLAGDSATVLRGLGAGKFGPSQPLVSTKNPLCMSVADVNGDGIPDLVIGEGLGDSGVLVFLGHANGTFGPALRTHVPLASVDVLSTGDLNHDGHRDVVVASQDPGSLGKVVVLLGKGNGRFRAPVTYRTGSHDDLIDALAVGDATGDHRLDVVAGIAGKVWILPGRGDGSFASPLTLPWHERPGPGIGAIAVGKLGRDRDPDIVLAAGYVEVFRGRGHGSFAPIKRYRVDSPRDGLSSVSLADVNGDGLPDVVAGEFGGLGAAVLEGTRGGGLGAAVILRAHAGAHDAVVGDLRGNGHLDIAVSNFDSGDISVLFNRGGGRFFGPSLNQNLFVFDSSGQRPVSSDQTIPSASLRFRGGTLHWRADGHAEQVALH